MNFHVRMLMAVFVWQAEVNGDITTLVLTSLRSQTEYDVAVTPVYDEGPGNPMLGSAITGELLILVCWFFKITGGSTPTNNLRLLVFDPWVVKYMTTGQLHVRIMTAMCESISTQIHFSWFHNFRHGSQLMCFLHSDTQTTLQRNWSWKVLYNSLGWSPTWSHTVFSWDGFGSLCLTLSLSMCRGRSCAQEFEVFWGDPDVLQSHVGAWSSRCLAVSPRMVQEGRDQLQIRMFTSWF